MNIFKKAVLPVTVMTGLLLFVSWKSHPARRALSVASSNVLLFRTKEGSVSIPAGQRQLIGTVDISSYSHIRVVSDERAGSGASVTLDLTIMDGNELVAQLDVLALNAHQQVTKVYDTPGTKLGIYANAAGGSGPANLDLLVYGSN